MRDQSGSFFKNPGRDDGGLARMFVVDEGEDIHISGMIQSNMIQRNFYWIGCRI